MRSWRVLVYKLDRFSRNKYETAINKKLLRDNGVKLISAMENIPDTPEGIILESLLEGMAEYYSAELSQKVLRGLNENRQKGLYTGGLVIFGYRANHKKIEICEPEAEIVRHIFEELTEGIPMKDIMEELNEKGILYRGKPFAKSTIYRLITNEKYVGIYRHGDEVYTNIYPPIVPEKVFYFVKEKLDANKYGKHTREAVYLLKEKVRCGYCGHMVVSESGTSHTNSVIRYYKCGGKKNSHIECESAPIRKELLEDIVANSTYEILNNPDTIDLIASKILIAHQKKNQSQALIEILQTEYAAVQRSIENILNNMEKGLVTQSMRDRLEQLEERKININEKLLLERSRQQKPLTKQEVETFLVTALSKKAKAMLQILIKEVKLFKDKIEIRYNYTDRDKDSNNDKTPDGENHQEFLFYEFEKAFQIDKKKINTPPETLTLKIEMYI